MRDGRSEGSQIALVLLVLFLGIALVMGLPVVLGCLSDTHSAPPAKEAPHAP